MSTKAKGQYRFTFGPWNIARGSDPFGPPVRDEIAFADKLATYKALGFDGVQMITACSANSLRHVSGKIPTPSMAALPATRRKTANTPSIVHAAPWTSLR